MFKRAYIPRTLNDVKQYERDVDVMMALKEEDLALNAQQDSVSSSVCPQQTPVPRKPPPQTRGLEGGRLTSCAGASPLHDPPSARRLEARLWVLLRGGDPLNESSGLAAQEKGDL